jgi:hypothetical protein
MVPKFLARFWRAKFISFRSGPLMNCKVVKFHVDPKSHRKHLRSKIVPLSPIFGCPARGLLLVLNDSRQTRLGVSKSAVNRMSNLSHEVLRRFEVVEVGTGRSPRKSDDDDDEHEVAKSESTRTDGSTYASQKVTARS